MKDNGEWRADWAELHKKCVVENNESDRTSQERAGYRNNIMADYCEELIIESKEAYYEGSPIMSDGYYDGIEDKLRILRPDSKVLEKVGS